MMDYAAGFGKPNIIGRGYGDYLLEKAFEIEWFGEEQSVNLSG